MSLSRVGAMILAGVILASCSSESESEWTAVMLWSDAGPCAGQRAAVPASGTASRSLDPENAQVFHTPTADYVSYSMQTREVFAYFSFQPSLPSAPSTDEARGQLNYAYVAFDLAQPPSFGGSLGLLSSSDLLDIEDFELFEVVDGRLRWRLVRPSPTGYDKVLSTGDQDPTNDPPSGTECITGDIAGLCRCSFSGPSIAVTIEGVTPL